MSRLDLLRNVLRQYFRVPPIHTGGNNHCVGRSWKEKKTCGQVWGDNHDSNHANAGKKCVSNASKLTTPSNEDEKYLYESSRTDSGFISSGNPLSGEIITSEEISSSRLHHHHHPQDSGVIEEEEEFGKNQAALMRLDSGIDTCLSQLSGLSLKQHPGLNDLGKEKAQPEERKVCNDQAQDNCYEQDEDGDTQLHIAIITGFLEVALAMIRAATHPRLLDTPNDDAQSPLHLAVITGQWKIARWLIVAGARPSPRNLTGDSPLHIAARAGDLLSCKAITDPVQQQERDLLGLSYPQSHYEHCEFDQWNYDGQTCVHVAAMHGQVGVLRHLVWYGADINAREGRGGYTALHMAIERGDERLVHFLLTECKKLNVRAVTYGGRSALQLGSPVAKTFLDALRTRGVPSPYSSEEEIDSDDDEIMYDEPTKNVFKPSMIINASA